MVSKMDEEENTGTENFLFDMNARLRSVEGRYNLLHDRVLVINENFVTHVKRTNSGNEGVAEDLKEIKQEVFKIKEALKHLVGEMEMFARRDDVKLLEKYINLWNPLNFVTEKDVIRLMKKENDERRLE